MRGFITGMNPFNTTILSTTVASSTIPPIFDSHTGLPLPRSAGSGSSNSFNTAHTSFPALQAEGETLLPRPIDGRSVGEHSPTRSQPDYTQGSPSKRKAPALGKGKQGWLGSLRRVFVSGPEDVPLPPIYRDVSPTRDAQPRRTVSAGATLWRRKQGKSDWQDSADLNPRSNTFTGSSSGAPQLQRQYTDRVEEDEDDWDIEQAVQNRVVQVMFTVPKERLRVVNCEDDEVLGSEVGSSVGGSLRSRKSVRVGRKSSLRGLVGRKEGDADLEAEAKEAKPLLVDLDKDETDDEVVRVDKGKGKEESKPEEEELRGGLGDERLQTPSQKQKGKVLDIVEKLERNSSPER